MSKNPKVSLERAAEFIWRNARLLERALFANAFLGGTPEPVRSAVLAYRNADGGFGNAMEPDVRAPSSAPLHCEIAMRSLQAAEIRDSATAAALCDYLTSIAEPDGRVPIVTRQIFDYPRASHWSEPLFGGDSPNPTAALAGMLLYQGVVHLWLAHATDWCWQRLERPIKEGHEILSAVTFLEHAPDRSHAKAVAREVASQANRASRFLMEPGSAKYGLTPLHLCPRPDAIARPAFSDQLLNAHLDDLASRQREDGGWPITWNAPSPAAETEWRGRMTFEALATLRAWGRV